MKKLVLTFVLLPVIVISFMNFYGGSTDPFHNETNKAFTCSSCHATIIDGIIIIGKEESQNLLTVDIQYVPDTDVEENEFTLVANVNAIKDKNGFLIRKPEENDLSENEYFQYPLKNLVGKKENTISIERLITEKDKANGYIAIEGVLSNLDGKSTGDYSFYKRVSLSAENSAPALKLYPSVASNMVSIENTVASKLLKVFDIQGKMVFQSLTEDIKTEIDLSNFQNGNYFAVVGQGENMFQSKFIVSK